MSNTLNAIKALHFQVTMPEHLADLPVLHAELFKDELTLPTLSLILSAPSIFSSLSCKEVNKDLVG